MIRRWVFDGSPDVDDLVTPTNKFVGLLLRNMSTDAGFSCSWSLIDMHLLNRLTSRVLYPAAYGVVEDVDLLDARNLVA